MYLSPLLPEPGGTCASLLSLPQSQRAGTSRLAAAFVRTDNEASLVNCVFDPNASIAGFLAVSCIENSPDDPRPAVRGLERQHYLNPVRRSGPPPLHVAAFRRFHSRCACPPPLQAKTARRLHRLSTPLHAAAFHLAWRPGGNVVAGPRSTGREGGFDCWRTPDSEGVSRCD